jgi:hypothetical protein
MRRAVRIPVGLAATVLLAGLLAAGPVWGQERPGWTAPADTAAPEPAPVPAPDSAGEPAPAAPEPGRPNWATLPEEPEPAAAVAPETGAPAVVPPTPAPDAGSTTGVPRIAVSGDPEDAGASTVLLLLDRQLSDAIFDTGPLAGYATAISPEGVLLDSNGAAGTGLEGVQARFRTFPADLKLERRPLRALASGTSGTSWGIFAVKRGEQTLTEGYYVASWRQEAEGWRIVAELAAGRPPAAPPALPARPPAVAPVGQAGAAAATVPGAPPSAAPVPASGLRPPGQPQPAPGALSGAPRPLRDALGRPVAPAQPTPEAGVQPAAPSASAPLPPS